MPECTLTAAELPQFLRHPDPTITCVRMNTPAYLPPNIRALPPLQYNFQKVDGRESGLVEFVAETAFDVDLKGNSNIKRVAITEASHLELANSRIETIQGNFGQVGLAQCHSFRQFEPNTNIRYLTLGLENIEYHVPLLRQLAKLPNVLDIECQESAHSENPGVEALIQIGICQYSGPAVMGNRLKNEEVRHMVNMIELFTSKPEAILDRYTEFACLPDFVLKHYAWEFEQYPATLVKLNNVLAAKLQELATAKIRSKITNVLDCRDERARP